MSDFDNLLFEDAESIKYQNLTEDFLHRLVIEQDDQFVGNECTFRVVKARVWRRNLGKDPEDWNWRQASEGTSIFRSCIEPTWIVLCGCFQSYCQMLTQTMLTSIAEMLYMDLEQLLTTEDGNLLFVRSLIKYDQSILKSS